GVGKTFAMLAEGRRRAGNGERVVVGWIESHGRPQTSGQLGGLEVIAPRAVAYRGTVFADCRPASPSIYIDGLGLGNLVPVQVVESRRWATVQNQVDSPFLEGLLVVGGTISS